MPIDRKVIDTNWKIAHGVLYTAHRLRGFNMNVDPKCFCGQDDECASHLFYYCPLMTRLLLWTQSIFTKVTSQSPALQLRHMFFGYNNIERDIVPPVLVYFLFLIKYFVWLARNDFRFNGKQPECDSIKKSVAIRINAHLLIFSKRFKSPSQRRSFDRSWNVLGKFAPNIRTINWF